MREVFFIFALSFVCLFPKFGKAQNTNAYAKDKIIVKIESEYAAQCFRESIKIPEFNKWLNHSPILQIEKAFSTVDNNRPIHPPQNRENNRLSNIYYFHLAEKANIPKIIRELQRLSFVAYAEPNYINQLTYSPSDTLKNKQWYLNAVQAFQAWDIEKGDTNVVIATTDTGIDTTHEDLVDNLAYNYDDPINGVDDDQDGYVDNFYGWNTGSNNNDISYHNSGHGSNVAGIAAATTDNVTGISGGGFNCRQLIVKIDNAQGQLSGSYEAIVYAAEHDAFVINCSWGSYIYSDFANDIINYATIDHGAMVICGAGNGPFSGPKAGIGVEDLFYPAAYKNAVAVGSTLPMDTVKESSNYGYWLDIFAPGEDMFTTNAAGGYSTNGGTSMAAPLVAAGAALVKSHFPQYSNKAVLMQLKSTADDINSINEGKYQNKTGSGRINFFKALTDTTHAGIIMENRKIVGSNGSSFANGDSLFISADFVNYLRDANNLKITLSTVNNQLQGVSTSISANSLLSGDTLKNAQNPFIFRIPTNLPIGMKVGFIVELNADNFQESEYFEITVNKDFLTLEENNLRITFSSEAGIGFSNGLGEGIIYKGGNSLLYEGSFAIAENPKMVVDEFRGNAQPYDAFTTKKLINRSNSNQADISLNSSFQDAADNRYKINTINFLYKNKLPNTAFYVYQIINKSNQQINDIYAGMLMDWDIENPTKNKITYDAIRKMSINYATDTNLYCGIKILSEGLPSSHYAIDNISGGAGGINIADGFSLEEKYTALSTMRNSAGTSSPEGNDVVDAIAINGKNIAADSSFVASFAIIVASDLDSLKKEADSAQAVFNRLPLDLEEVNPRSQLSLPLVYPNPSINNCILEFKLSQRMRLTLSIYDLNGKEVMYIDEKFYGKGIHYKKIMTDNLASGQYIIQLKGNGFKTEKKLMVIEN